MRVCIDKPKSWNGWREAGFPECVLFGCCPGSLIKIVRRVSDDYRGEDMVDLSLNWT